MKRIASSCCLALVGLAVAQLYLTFIHFDLGPRNGLAALVAGTAERPFVYRQLAPLLIRAIMAATGVGLELAATWLIVASFVGWLLALRWLADALFEPAGASWAAVIAAGPVGLLFVSGGYIYDPVTLALFTLALALLAHRHWMAYLVLFPALVLCRETAILLVPVWLLWGWDHAESGRYRRGLAWQVVIFVSVKNALAQIYAGSAGQALEFNLPAHLAFLLQYPLPNILALSVYGAGLAAALWRWKTQPPFLQAAAVMLPAMFLAYWLLGYPGEIRVFLEVYPVLYLLAWHTVWDRGVLPTVRFMRRRPLGSAYDTL